jgi:putative flavoprotein involved in K+ transport
MSRNTDEEPTVSEPTVEHVETLVIGGGQAGLSVGYHLARRGLPFLIVDANQRVGDSWRHRWDSLQLFTPARFDGLDGMRFPAPPHYFPSKDEMADYLETYAEKFGLRVRSGVAVDRLFREEGRFVATTREHRFQANHVVVAMSTWQKPRLPAMATDLAPEIRQIHSAEYRNPGQLADGDVLVVGAGNSGAEIALEVNEGRRVLLAGPDLGHVPFRVESLQGRLLLPIVFRIVFHRLLTTGTPLGRKARPKALSKGEPLIRVKPKDLSRAGVERVPRVVGTREGLPRLEDGQTAEVRNVIWCTGFDPGFSWIDLPAMDEGRPVHVRGVVDAVPGLYFVGLKFLYSQSSGQVHGVGRDAAWIAHAIADNRVASERVSRGGAAAMNLGRDG